MIGAVLIIRYMAYFLLMHLIPLLFSVSLPKRNFSQMNFDSSQVSWNLNALVRRSIFSWYFVKPTGHKTRMTKRILGKLRWHLSLLLDDERYCEGVLNSAFHIFQGVNYSSRSCEINQINRTIFWTTASKTSLNLYYAVNWSLFSLF